MVLVSAALRAADTLVKMVSKLAFLVIRSNRWPLVSHRNPKFVWLAWVLAILFVWRLVCVSWVTINSEITPIEAGLQFTICKRRRDEGNFPGAKVILQQLKDGVEKMRVGFTIEGKTAAREGYTILDEKGETTIGRVTSGSLAPSLENTTVGMGYVPPAFSKAGTPVVIDIRGKKVPAKIANMPFVPHNYYRGKGKQ